MKFSEFKELVDSNFDEIDRIKEKPGKKGFYTWSKKLMNRKGVGLQRLYWYYEWRFVLRREKYSLHTYRALTNWDEFIGFLRNYMKISKKQENEINRRLEIEIETFKKEIDSNTWLKS